MNVFLIVATPLLGMFIAHRPLTIPGVFALAGAVLIHSFVRPNASLFEMTAIDTTSYLLMSMLLDLPEVVLFVVMAQIYIFFLFVPLRLALLTAAGFVCFGLLAVGVTMSMPRLERPLSETIGLLVVVTVSVVGHTLGVMIQARLEMHRGREREERLQAEKDALLVEKDEALVSLAMAQAELLNAQKLEAIGGLAAGIAHEINTPIQYVGDNSRFVQESLEGLFELSGAASALSEAVHNGEETTESNTHYMKTAAAIDVAFLADELPAAMEESIDGLDEVARIVRALKSFAHPGSSEKVPEDLNEIISTTVAVSRNEWKYVAEMDLVGLDGDLPQVPAMAGPLKQVILNMVVNAAHAIEPSCDASGEKGTISIATAIIDGSAVIRITDTGTGIPVEARDRIFEPFFTTKEVGRGSGQGLPIAKSIVEKHDGELRFETAVGEGTSFIIELPLEQTGGSTEDPTDRCGERDIAGTDLLSRAAR